MTSLEVDRIEWMRIYVVTCPVCSSEGGWRLWTKERPFNDPDAGLECRQCGLDWHHPLVYPAYVEARAERIAAGTDTELPPLEETIEWRPHVKDSLDIDGESNMLPQEWWSPWNDRDRFWPTDWPDLWQADGIVTGIDKAAAADAGCDLATARRLWWVEPEIIAIAKEKLAELVGDKLNRAQFYHGKLGPLLDRARRRDGENPATD